MKGNNTTIEKRERSVARPLKVLIPLIQRDIANAEHAGKMFKIAAGGKLLEARQSSVPGGWLKWLDDNFHLSAETATLWMRWWEAENVRGEEYETAEDFQRAHRPSRRKNPIRKFREYQAPVDKILTGVNTAQMAVRARDAAKEQELEQKLAMQLIKIGYGVLATKLHPDKGGSIDAMRRLNKVVKTLRSVYSSPITY